MFGLFWCTTVNYFALSHIPFNKLASPISIDFFKFFFPLFLSPLSFLLRGGRSVAWWTLQTMIQATTQFFSYSAFLLEAIFQHIHQKPSILVAWNSWDAAMDIKPHAAEAASRLNDCVVLVSPLQVFTGIFKMFLNQVVQHEKWDRGHFYKSKPAIKDCSIQGLHWNREPKSNATLLQLIHIWCWIINKTWCSHNSPD